MSRIRFSDSAQVRAFTPFNPKKRERAIDDDDDVGAGAGAGAGAGVGELAVPVRFSDAQPCKQPLALTPKQQERLMMWPYPREYLRACPDKYRYAQFNPELGTVCCTKPMGHEIEAAYALESRKRLKKDKRLVDSRITAQNARILALENRYKAKKVLDREAASQSRHDYRSRMRRIQRLQAELAEEVALEKEIQHSIARAFAALN
jgi:hypothetical protein